MIKNQEANKFIYDVITNKISVNASDHDVDILLLNVNKL
jgi:hypothetical protein